MVGRCSQFFGLHAKSLRRSSARAAPGHVLGVCQVLVHGLFSRVKRRPLRFAFRPFPRAGATVCELDRSPQAKPVAVEARQATGARAGKGPRLALTGLAGRLLASSMQHRRLS
eukprot:14835214-Alexandrium_andersonii.AAC.1